MNEQRRQILQMLAEGKITADEAERLSTSTTPTPRCRCSASDTATAPDARCQPVSPARHPAADQPYESGWPDSNRRPPAPKAGALTKLRYIPPGRAHAPAGL